MRSEEQDQIPNAQASIAPATEQAILWFATLMQAEPAADEALAFQAWLAADPGHARAYRDIERLWSLAAVLPDETPAPRANGRRHFMALTLLAGASLGGWHWWRHKPSGTYDTGIGEWRRVALPDGTQAELATNTEIAVHFDEAVRLVSLLRGEAFFTVAADPRRVFRVKAAGGMAEALGTAFSITLQGDMACLQVTEHQVRLTTEAGAITLTAGQQTLFNGQGATSLENFDASTASSWRRGQLIFVSQPLDAVLMEIERWLPGRIILTDRRLATRPVTALINLGEPVRILQSLQASLPVEITSLTPYLTLVSGRT